MNKVILMGRLTGDPDFLVIGESLKVEEFLRLHTAFLVMQLEIAGLCFGLSAFIKGSGRALDWELRQFFISGISSPISVKKRIFFVI